MTKFDDLFAEEDEDSEKRKTRENHPKISDGKLYKEVSQLTGYSQKEVTEICTQLFELIVLEVFQVGNRVNFRNFGTFWQKKTKSNNNNLVKINHTRAKDPLSIKANRVNYSLTFRMSKNIRQRISSIRRKD